MKRTFSIDKTNPRITGNIKCVVDSNDGIFLESIDSSEYLSQSYFKGFKFNPNLSWGSNLRNFASKWSDMDEVYETVDEASIDKNNNINTTYHQLYHKGVRSNTNSLIDGSLRYFAPLHIGTNIKKRPDAFLIFAIPDEPSQMDDYGSKYIDWINKGELVKIFDLTKVKKKIFSDIKDSYVQFDFNENISAVGTSLTSGLEKRAQESNGDDFIENEVTITEWENNITNIYQRNQMVYGNIVNLEFAFDDSGENRFKRYVGFYVKYNEVDFDTLKSYEGSGAIRLLSTRDKIRAFDNSDNENIYTTITRNVSGSTVGLHKKSVVRFKLQLNPSIGEHLYIKTGDVVEHDVVFDYRIIGESISQTSQNIVTDINKRYQGKHSSVSAKFMDGWITLNSNATITDFDGDLNISGGSYIRIQQPIWSIDSRMVNDFTVVDNRTILLTEYIDPNKFGGYIRYEGRYGVVKDSLITKIEKYGEYYLYQMEDTIDKDSQPSTFWFVDRKGDIPLLCSIIDHRELDVRQTVSDYSNVYDFSIEDFKQHLLNRIDHGNEFGSILKYYQYESLDEVSKEQLLEYRRLLRENVLLYFQDIDVEPQTLIKDIDLGTVDSTLTDNEYTRFGEYLNENLNQINRLYPIINKWSMDVGMDVYNNPYRLNVALPFGIDNYSTNQKMDRRDIRFHTHSWYILGDGVPPYIQQGDPKRLSYSKHPISEELLLDADMDAYTLLEHNTGSGIERGYTFIEYDPIQEKSFAFFRGLKWFFEDSTLDNYKFAIVLSGSKYIEDKTYEMEFIQNDIHKTMTLMIWFYIPDPVITSLENGLSNYTLDRSLLYFSDDVLTTSKEPLYFGEAQISLNLYDNQSSKKYLGSVLTNNWYHTLKADNNIIWVGRGIRTSTDTPFNDMFGLGADFTIYFSDSDDIQSPNYGMYIEFKNMVEVGANHFWCKQIVIKNNTTYEPSGINDDDISNNIVNQTYSYDVLQEFLMDANVFNTNNTIYSSKGIAKENSSYTKTVTAESNIARYKEITIPNIKNDLATNPVKIHGTNKKILIGVVESRANDISISKEFNDVDGIELLDNPYIFPINRYDGTYKPQTKLLYSATDSIDAKNTWIGGYNTPTYERLSILPSPSDIIPRTMEYKQSDINQMSTDTYPFYTQVGVETYSKKSIGWIYNPVEYVGEPSLVFNGADSLNFETKQTKVELLDVMYQRASRWLQLDKYELDREQNLNFMNIATKVFGETLDNYDVKKMIVQNFIKNTFVEIYHIQSISDEQGNEYEWLMDGTELTIDTNVEGLVYTIWFEK